MKQIAVADLSAQLPSLLDDVARGEEIMLLRDGEPVARLMPSGPTPDPVSEFSPEETERRREAVRRLRENARQINLGGTHDEIKTWIEEGRG